MEVKDIIDNINEKKDVCDLCDKRLGKIYAFLGVFASAVLIFVNLLQLISIDRYWERLTYLGLATIALTMVFATLHYILNEFNTFSATQKMCSNAIMKSDMLYTSLVSIFFMLCAIYSVLLFVFLVANQYFGLNVDILSFENSLYLKMFTSSIPVCVILFRIVKFFMNHKFIIGVDDNILTIQSHSRHIKFLHMFKYFLVSVCVLLFGFYYISNISQSINVI